MEQSAILTTLQNSRKKKSVLCVPTTSMVLIDLEIHHGFDTFVGMFGTAYSTCMVLKLNSIIVPCLINCSIQYSRVFCSAQIKYGK